MNDFLLPAALAALAAAALLLLALACAKLAAVRRRLQTMQNALRDIEHGNGNRRILAAEGDLTAPLAYRMNEIINHYEAQLGTMRRADETNKQLMTSLSHDVRTPLTTLIGYLDAAHRGVVTGPEREEYYETARSKAHDLKAYIDVLFDWFKLNSNEFSLSLRPVEMTELTRTLLKDWIPVFEEKGIDYDVDIPEHHLMAKVDLDGYARVLNNLVQNVVAHSHADKIGVQMAGRRGQLTVTVCDNGVGISREDLGHIFDRLYKCDKARSAQGSGLGLSIVRQMVEKMKGTIIAESIPNQRTAFTLTFPLDRDATGPV